MTLSRAGAPENFSRTADAYQSTMAEALTPVAAEVVRRAELQPGEWVLDVGTGTGIAAQAAVGADRRVIGLDAAPGMLRLARESFPAADFVEGDFSAMPFADGTFQVVLAVHALLFAEDRVAALAEWRRVAAPLGRLSLSVPGPVERSPHRIYAGVYKRHGLSRASDYPSPADLVSWTDRAGWVDGAVATDADVVIGLRDEAAFRRWLTVGSRGRATRGWTRERIESLTNDLLAATPRAADGGFAIPFGTLYLTARRPA